MLKTLSKAILLSGDLLASLQRLYAQTEAYLKMIGLASHAAFLPVIFKHPACRTGEFSSIFTTRRQVASHILNDLARAGIEVERKARTVKIFSIEIEKINLPYVTMQVHCSKGTYIRTLCADIGEVLGVGACMESLVRTRGTHVGRN